VLHLRLTLNIWSQPTSLCLEELGDGLSLFTSWREGGFSETQGVWTEQEYLVEENPMRGCVAKPDIEAQGAFAAASLTPLKRYE